jgi:AP2 domain
MKDYAIRFVEPAGKSGYYLVAFTRRLIYYNKTFAPATHGGKRVALAAAKQWRDQMLAGLPPITKQEYARQLRSSNTSGVAGVMRLNLRQESSRGNWRSYPTWVAVTPKGVSPRKSKSFSILRYGEQRAFELACAAREHFVQMASGYWAQGVPPEFLPSERDMPRRWFKQLT